MSVKKWIVGNPDREKAKLLAEECDIDPFVALIANVRGIDDAGELELMLSDEPVLCDPLELADIKIAAECINNAVEKNKKIAIYGDYDCDGVVATALLYDYLKGRNADVTAYIPDRISEGYGMNKSAVESLKNKGIQLIITVDNGIACAAEIEYAKSLGIETVVTDHHIPPADLPQAVAVVDPHRTDCPSTFKEICGAEVAFKLVCVLDDKEPEQMLSKYADILAVATVGDVMPLINENRSIVKSGIAKIKTSPSVGIAAILNIAGIDRADITAGKISFGIVPRINAAGRIGSAFRAFELLTSKNVLDALKIAGPIDDDNSRRQQTEKDIYKAAISIIEEHNYQYDRVIVVCGENWHLGVLGIAATRICEHYGKPAIVLSNDGGIAHGSGRSFSGFNLYNSIDACCDVLLKYGGHELAAGVSVDINNVPIFRDKINAYARTVPYAVPMLKIDCRINPAGMNTDMAFAVKALEPFGNGNSTPVFGIFGASIQKITPIGGNKHLKLLCNKNGNVFQCLLFGVTPEQFCFCVGDTVDLAVTLDANLYQGQYALSVFVKAVKMSDDNENLFFEGKKQYDDFMSGNAADYNVIFPDRAQVAKIYKMVKSSPVKTERLKYLNDTDLNYGKTAVCVKTLCELKLIDEKNGVLMPVNTQQKTDLLNSKLYRSLYERVNNNE